MGQGLTTELDSVTLTGVAPVGQELGRGAYGRVFKVQYRGGLYAAKEIHSILIDVCNEEEKKFIKDKFVNECLCCKTISHQNIVEFKGVYYHESAPRRSIAKRMISSICGNLPPQSIRPPIMVMELMDTSLDSFIKERRSNIKIQTKLSILCDVSEGLNFLHSSAPAIIHRDLTSNNVMLTSELVAKIGDLGVAKVLSAESMMGLTSAPGTLDFMPPEALLAYPVYDTPIDVFSFAAIVLHVFSENWPAPSAPKILDPTTRMLVAVSEADRRKDYLDTMTGNLTTVKELIKRCLADDPNNRPSIKEVKKNLRVISESWWISDEKGAYKADAKSEKLGEPAQHPKYSDMITAAIASNKEQNGCSRQKILKYIDANYETCDRYKDYVRVAIKTMLQNGELIQTKGIGANGSFKLAEKAVRKNKTPKKTPVKKPKKVPQKGSGGKPKKAAQKKESKKKSSSCKKAAAKNPKMKELPSKPKKTQTISKKKTPRRNQKRK